MVVDQTKPHVMVLEMTDEAFCCLTWEIYFIGLVRPTSLTFFYELRDLCVKLAFNTFPTSVLLVPISLTPFFL